MARLTFWRANSNLMLTTDDGQLLGSWEAYNNVASSSLGVWPKGEYKFSHYNAHAGLDADSSYGSQGVLVFQVSGRTGMGVHAGRQNKADGRGRKGPQHCTMGCIRTTEAAMKKINSTHGGDPLKTIFVSDGLAGPMPKLPANQA